jgi:hypothetical protein
LLRTVASGEPHVAARVLRYRDTMNEILLLVLRGGEPTGIPGTDEELTFCRMMQNQWFAEMVGWTGGLQDLDTVVDHVLDALRRLSRSLEVP